MNKCISMIVLLSGCLLPGLGNATSGGPPQDEMKRLTALYQAYEKEAHAIIARRKALPEYFTLLQKLGNLGKELELLGVVLEKEAAAEAKKTPDKESDKQSAKGADQASQMLQQTCQQVLQREADIQVAQIEASRKFKVMNNALQAKHKAAVAKLNARTEALNRKIRAGTPQSSLSSEISKIRTEQSRLQEFQRVHNALYDKPDCATYIYSIKNTSFGKQASYDAAAAQTLCQAIHANKPDTNRMVRDLMANNCLDAQGKPRFSLDFAQKKGAMQKAEKADKTAEAERPQAEGTSGSFYAIPFYTPEAPGTESRNEPYADCKIIFTENRVDELQQLISSATPPGTHNFSAWGPWSRQAASRFCSCVSGKSLGYLKDADYFSQATFPKFPDGCR